MTVSHLSPLPSTGSGGDSPGAEIAAPRASRRPVDTRPRTRQERRDATADLLARAHASWDELESRRPTERQLGQDLPPHRLPQIGVTRRAQAVLWAVDHGLADRSVDESRPVVTS